MSIPAMVANPPVITACNSDLVIIGRYGLIISGASVYYYTTQDEDYKIYVTFMRMNSISYREI